MSPAEGVPGDLGADPAVDPFVEYRRTHDRALRNRLVEQHRQVGDHLVRRYARRGVSEDDLRQIALLGVIAAVERFDPSLGVNFSTFAGRTVEGELKRYLRDRTWIVRPPRRAQELHLELRRADEELTHRLGRSPTIAELAEAVDDSLDHVLEALEAGMAHQATSLDQPVAADDEQARPLAERVLVTLESGFADVEARAVVAGLLDDLDERDRQVVRMRFFEGMTQPEIAARLGVSQSYLSRIIRRILVDLRDRIDRLERGEELGGEDSNPQ